MSEDLKKLLSNITSKQVTWVALGILVTAAITLFGIYNSSHIDPLYDRTDALACDIKDLAEGKVGRDELTTGLGELKESIKDMDKRQRDQTRILTRIEEWTRNREER